MNHVQTNYVIHDKTSALLPVDHEKYKTIVLEAEKEILVNRSPLQLIKDSCLHYGSDYNGRKKAVTYHLGYNRKVPIPISIAKNIYAFLTHALKDSNCIWFFLDQLSESHHPVRKSKTHSEIFLKSGKSLNVARSIHRIRKQVQRTILCKAHFSHVSYLIK